MQEQDRIDLRKRLAELDEELSAVRRALSVARPRASLPPGAFQIVCVRISGHEYGVLSESVREIVRYASLSPIPGAPRTVEGALNLRGELIPVVNVPLALGLGDVDLDRKTAIIVAHVHQCSLGLVVDRVVDVATFEQSLLEDGTNGLMDSRFVQGMARSAARFVQILDLEAFASPGEIAQFVARASEVPPVPETGPTSGAHS